MWPHKSGEKKLGLPWLFTKMEPPELGKIGLADLAHDEATPAGETWKGGT
jgi:hypothetical protein